MEQAKILIIDDDRELCEMLKEYLQPERLAVVACATGEEGIEALKAGAFDFLSKPVDLEALRGSVLALEEQVGWAPDVEWTGRRDDLVVGPEVGTGRPVRYTSGPGK